MMTSLITLSVACFVKEAEANHPELLELPDDIEICEKAAGYASLLHLVQLFNWCSEHL